MFLPKSRPFAALASRLCACNLSRIFTSGCLAAEAKLPPRLVLKEEDLEEAFLKGTGPGGQKINKTSSAVQLKHIPTGTVTKCQATRSRSQNRKIARRLLAEKIEAVEEGPESRTAIKAEIKSRKKASKGKKARRKHRAAQGEKEDADGQEEEVTDDDDYDIVADGGEVMSEVIREERV